MGQIDLITNSLAVRGLALLDCVISMVANNTRWRIARNFQIFFERSRDTFQ